MRLGPSAVVPQMMSSRPGHTRLFGQAIPGTPVAVMVILNEHVVGLFKMIGVQQRLYMAGADVRRHNRSTCRRRAAGRAQQDDERRARSGRVADELKPVETS
jgi:hypothetical protein